MSLYSLSILSSLGLQFHHVLFIPISLIPSKWRFISEEEYYHSGPFLSYLGCCLNPLSGLQASSLNTYLLSPTLTLPHSCLKLFHDRKRPSGEKAKFLILVFKPPGLDANIIFQPHSHTHCVLNIPNRVIILCESSSAKNALLPFLPGKLLSCFKAQIKY